MALFGGLFGGKGDSSTVYSTTTSTTQTNTGSGTAIAGGVSGGTVITNDPATALAALQANAYQTDRALDSVDSTIVANRDVTNFALSNTLDTVKQIVDSQTGLSAKTQELFYNKLADNAGVAPQTLAQQSQDNAAMLIKIALIGAALVAGLYLLKNSSK